MLRNTFADNFAQAWKQCFAFDQIIYRYSHKISKVAFNRTLRLYLSESELVGEQPTQLWKVAKKPWGQVVHPSKGNSFCYEGSWSNISSFVSQIDDLWDGWCSVVLCGIVLSRLTHRAKTLIIAGLCIEWGVKGCQNGDGGVSRRRVRVPLLYCWMGYWRQMERHISHDDAATMLYFDPREGWAQTQKWV